MWAMAEGDRLLDVSKLVPWLLVLLAVITGAFVVFGEEALGRLRTLRDTIAVQRERNQELQQVVDELRGRVAGLQHDDRVLEKAARNELGMAKPNEYIFIFDDENSDPASVPSP